MKVRATGYALDGPGTVELAAGKTATADLKLKPAPVAIRATDQRRIAGERARSHELKRNLLNCTDCHSLHRIFGSKHSRDDFMKVFDRMGTYYPGASDMQPQRLVGEHRRPAVNPALADSFAGYLEALNLSSSAAHRFEFTTTPRANGRATRVIITEYDLPRKEIQPHDVIVDRDGGVWFSHFGEQFLSKLDPSPAR